MENSLYSISDKDSAISNTEETSLSNSQKLRNLINMRKEDDDSNVYNNDIVEIYVRFSNNDISLKIKEVYDTNPPVFDMVAVDDILIKCEKDRTHILNNDIVLCIRYEEVCKTFSLGNELLLSSSENELHFPKYITPCLMNDELDVTFDIYYDPKKEGLVHPVVKIFFRENLWEEFKRYQQYL